VEVETPAMQAIPGGAAAQPFKTFHNALGCDFYLRIALELYHKRLLVGGIDRLFEIGKNFRNEGLSRRHNPEFTMLEAYCAFGDYEQMMELVQSLICHISEKVFPENKLRFARNRDGELQRVVKDVADKISNYLTQLIDLSREAKVFDAQTARGLLVACEAVHKLFGPGANQVLHWAVAKKALAEIGPLVSAALALREKGELEHQSETIDPLERSIAQGMDAIERFTKEEWIDLTPNWRRARYKDLIKEKAGADWFEISPIERRQRAHDLGAEIGKEYEDFEVTGAVFEKLIEPSLIQPTFVTHLPKELVPLAKLSPDDPTTVEVFECCINGQEIAPGYTEQNDPIAQRNTLEHQAGGEQQKLDEDFLVALEHGMPPAGGIGIGIDRLCMMLLGQESIRDVILFPQLKPK
jgi:lysyl-tRNA synthetase class 2